MMHPKEWMAIRPEGLYCVAGDFYIDPTRPVARAVITHGHSDHARSGHGTVYATPETLAIMAVRYGEGFTASRVALEYGEEAQIGAASVSLAPAGHILGSAQAVISHQGGRIVISGDFKRAPDPTCVPFKPIACDVFVTEATFGLPVFRHPETAHEIKKLLHSLQLFPDRCHVVGVYALGKCQRVMMELRKLGYDKPFYTHGAVMKLCALYQQHGLDLGELVAVTRDNKKDLAGEIVFAPPSALDDRWARGLPHVLTCMASGWMQIRARAKQKLVELPLIISDHADWDELLQTLADVGAPDVWITHGRDDALAYQAAKLGYNAQALSLLGYEDEGED
jgi:putative mRNA 3-end processing factor